MGFTAHAQRYGFQSDWKASIGVNAVGSLGTRNPVSKLDEYAFSFPIMVAVERQWSEHYALEQDLSLNQFKAGKPLDGGAPKESFTYFSTNTNFKWYFTDYLFQDLDALDLYVSGGLGIFYMSELNASANLSAGVQYWFSDKIAVRLQSAGKFAANANNHQYDNNHFQHSLLVVFRM